MFLSINLPSSHPHVVMGILSMASGSIVQNVFIVRRRHSSVAAVMVTPGQSILFWFNEGSAFMAPIHWIHSSHSFITHCLLLVFTCLLRHAPDERQDKTAQARGVISVQFGCSVYCLFLHTSL